MVLVYQAAIIESRNLIAPISRINMHIILHTAETMVVAEEE